MNRIVCDATWRRDAFTLWQAASALTAAGWRITVQTDRQVVATHGSRFRMRMLGLAFRSVRDNMPVVLTITDTGTALVVTGAGDPGAAFIDVTDISIYYRDNLIPGFEVLARLARYAPPLGGPHPGWRR